jgi:hypothetical protein
VVRELRTGRINHPRDLICHNELEIL